MKALVVLAAMSATAHADFANNELIHAHVDTILTGPHEGELFASHLTTSLDALIPIYGTYELDQKVFGSTRPAAIVFDWVLGGLAPVSLGVAAALTHDETRAVLGWTALGLYATTRIGILVIGNLHVSEFNRYLQLRLAPSTQGLVVSASASF